jgi:hypothetical protein
MSVTEKKEIQEIKQKGGRKGKEKWESNKEAVLPVVL